MAVGYGGIGPGTSLAGGRYVVEELIGEGGMAAVFRAHDTALDRTVAVKAMSTEIALDETYRRRFRREAQSVARLSHPCVIAIHDTGEERFADRPPVPYLVMEFIRGRSLAELLERRRIAGSPGLPLARALRFTADVLAALAVSHAGGLVHRDIKPANVMVTDDDAVKVMDFGIARVADHDGGTALTRTGYMIGTPHYMSPEQIEGRGNIDARTDLYSVGVMLFQLLSGHPPFDGDSGFSIGYLHVTTAPPALASMGVAVPGDVEALITRALQKDPGDRFPDAGSMRAEVERIRALSSQPTGLSEVSAPPLPPPSPPGFPLPPPSYTPTVNDARPAAPQTPDDTPLPWPSSPRRSGAAAPRRSRAGYVAGAYGLLLPALFVLLLSGKPSFLSLVFSLLGASLAVLGASRRGERYGARAVARRVAAGIPLVIHGLLLLNAVTKGMSSLVLG